MTSMVLMTHLHPCKMRAVTVSIYTINALCTFRAGVKGKRKITKIYTYKASRILPLI